MHGMTEVQDIQESLQGLNRRMSIVRASSVGPAPSSFQSASITSKARFTDVIGAVVPAMPTRKRLLLVNRSTVLDQSIVTVGALVHPPSKDLCGSMTE